MKKWVALGVSAVMTAGLLLGSALCVNADSGAEEVSDYTVKPAAELISGDDFSVDMTGVSAEGVKIAFMTGDLGNPYCALLQKGFLQACADYGIPESDYISVEGGADANSSIEKLETLLSDDYDILIFSPYDGEAEVPLVEKAVSSGIPVITLTQYCANASGAIRLDQYEYGVKIGTNAAEWINENLDGVANIAVLSEDLYANSIPRGDGIVDTLTELCPNSTILTRESCADMQDGMDSMESIILQNPEVQVVVCCNDTIGLGAYQAMTNEGYSGDDIAIFSADKTDEAVAAIVQGGIYRGTVDLYPEWQSYTGVELGLYQLANGIPEEQTLAGCKMVIWNQEDLIAEAAK